MKKLLLITVFLIFSITNSFSQELEILSKADAQKMFDSSRSDWNNNVKNAAASGVSQAIGPEEEGLQMLITYPNLGTMMIHPNYYMQENSPLDITVIIFYRNKQMLDEVKFKEILKKTEKQMKPEFIVKGFFRLDNNNLPIASFYISKNN